MLGPAVRFVLALLGAVAGYQIGERLRVSSFTPHLNQGGKVLWLLLFTLAGFGLGWLLGVVLVRLIHTGLGHVDEALAGATGAEVVVAIGGVVVGIAIATLISVALADIPYVGPYLSLPIYLLAGYFTAYVAAKKHIEILRLLGVRGAFDVLPGQTPAKVMDSSAVIDGRILDIVKTGFVEGELVVPRFVVEELQRLADSADAEKRVRGRRGLDFVGACRIHRVPCASTTRTTRTSTRWTRSSCASQAKRAGPSSPPTTRWTRSPRSRACRCST